MRYPKQPIESGNWPDGTKWELLPTNTPPPKELCTATFCVAIAAGRIVLARSARGWGVIGGHIEEKDKTESAALDREALEEGGVIIAARGLFAVCRMTSPRPMSHPDTGKPYPFPTGYMTFFWATTDQPLLPPTGKEIIEAGSFSITELPELKPLDQRVVALGWSAYVQQAEG